MKEEGEGATFDIRAFRQHRPAPEADKVVKKAIEVLTSGVPKDNDKVAMRRSSMPAWLQVAGA